MGLDLLNSPVTLADRFQLPDADSSDSPDGGEQSSRRSRSSRFEAPKAEVKDGETFKSMSEYAQRETIGLCKPVTTNED